MALVHSNNSGHLPRSYSHRAVVRSRVVGAALLTLLLFAPPTAAAGHVQLKPRSVSFRKVEVWQTATKQLTLVNNDKVDHQIYSIVSSNPAFAPTQSCLGTLPARARCQMWITFAPRAAAKPKRTRVTGLLTLADDEVRPPRSVHLSGIAFCPGSSCPTQPGTTVTTGSDGVATFPGAKVALKLSDNATGQPTVGINATLLSESNEDTFVLVDPSGNYLPRIITETPVSGPSLPLDLGSPKVASTTIFPVTLVPVAYWPQANDSTLPVTEITDTAVATDGVWRELLGGYQCNTASLAEIESKIIEEADKILVKAALKPEAKLIVISLGDAIAGGAPGTINTGPLWVLTFGHVAALGLESGEVQYYLDNGYQLSDQFAYCQLEGLPTVAYGHVLLMEPVGPPSAPAASSLTGIAIDAITQRQITNVDVELRGPTPTGLSSADGSYSFSSLIPGTYDLQGSKTGYANNHFTIHILPATNQSNIRLYQPGTFVATGLMRNARAGHTRTLLSDGKVLVAGGYNDSDGFLQTADLYDPALAEFSPAGDMNSARSFATATLISGCNCPADGKVLLAGGLNSAGGFNSSGAVQTAELYDPVAATFTATGQMTSARFFHVAALLQNGQVLIAGGIDNSGNVLSSAELYDPSSGSFSPTASMQTQRAFPSATIITGCQCALDGQVLIAGGVSDLSGVVGGNPFGVGTGLASAELYNPAAGGRFTLTSEPMSTSRDLLGVQLFPGGIEEFGPASHTATLLNGGAVLVAGGIDQSGNVLSSAEIFDPSSGAFAATSSMSTPRAAASAAELVLGKALITGGDDQKGDALPTAEIFDQTSNSFSLVSPQMSMPRAFQTTTHLANGQVLISGGFNATSSGNPNHLSSAEVYTP